MKFWFRARSVYFGVPRKWVHLMSEEMITTDIDMIRRPSRYPIVGSSPTDFGEASTMFGLIKLNLLISTTNNPPRRKDLGESPRIHQAFHRKFTATTRENQDQDLVSAPLHCQVDRSRLLSRDRIMEKCQWCAWSSMTWMSWATPFEEIPWNPHISSLKSNMKNRKADWNHTIEICRVM